MKSRQREELYRTSDYKSKRCDRFLKDIKTYCMFIGYPKSGHSLVGSLLDAHPNIVIAHELDALRLISAGFSKKQLYYLLLSNSRTFAKNGRRYFRFSYRVPNQWQGKFTKLQVIGDKKGGKSTVRFGEDPELLGLLDQAVDNRKFVHVIRNPYDNISTMHRWATGHKGRAVEPIFSVDRYFGMCATIDKIKKRLTNGDMFDLRHESLIEDPGASLLALTRFLGVESSKDYLEQCASIVYKSPHKSRHKMKWTPALVEIVRERMERYSFLEGYSFDN